MKKTVSGRLLYNIFCNQSLDFVTRTAKKKKGVFVV